MKIRNELARGLMTGVTSAALRIHLQRLGHDGCLLPRRGKAPYTWKLEHRPDYDKIAADLQRLGYALDVG